MSRYKDLKAQLNQMHRLQSHKKAQMRAAVSRAGAYESRIQQNTVRLAPRGGAEYAPWEAVRYLHRCYRTISEIQKELNHNLRVMRLLRELMQKWEETTKSKEVL